VIFKSNCSLNFWNDFWNVFSNSQYVIGYFSNVILPVLHFTGADLDINCTCKLMEIRKNETSNLEIISTCALGQYQPAYYLLQFFSSLPLFKHCIVPVHKLLGNTHIVELSLHAMSLKPRHGSKSIIAVSTIYNYYIQ